MNKHHDNSDHAAGYWRLRTILGFVSFGIDVVIRLAGEAYRQLTR